MFTLMHFLTKALHQEKFNSLRQKYKKKKMLECKNFKDRNLAKLTNYFPSSHKVKKWKKKNCK